ncbi:MAG: hypothetical protein JW860_01850 [Sedimentisphaerales bacterium]|nr:hypothetical protein [Sedimentisphaerales bacterium]
MNADSVNSINQPAAAYEKYRQLRQKASEVVNQVFYGTLLREFREAQQPTLLDSGPGVKTFMRQLDMELIHRISQRGDAPLVKALIKQLGGDRYKLESNLSEAKAIRPVTVRNRIQ